MHWVNSEKYHSEREKELDLGFSLRWKGDLQEMCGQWWEKVRKIHGAVATAQRLEGFYSFVCSYQLPVVETHLHHGMKSEMSQFHQELL